MGATDVNANASLHDQYTTRAVLFQPDRTPRQIAHAFVSMKAHPMIQGQGTFEVTFPLYYIDQTTGARTLHPMAAVTNTSGGATAYDEEWLNWTFDWYARGSLKFSGPVVRVTITHKGDKSSAFVTLECITIETWGMGGRIIETATNAKWAKSATSWDDMIRDILRTNMEAGSITKPGDYPVSPLRSDFGPFTFTVQSDTGTATAADHKVQTGKSVQDTVREICTTPDDENDWCAIVATESTAATWNLSVVVGRPGTAREGIGSDLSASVMVDGYRGNITGAKRVVDHLILASVYKVGGSGRGSSQGLSYVVDAGTATAIGAREDDITVPTGGTAAERENEARKAINDQKQSKHRTTTLGLQETSALRAFVDFDIGDSIAWHDIILEKTIANADDGFVRGIEASFVAPGPWKIKVDFGSPERNATRENGRSGGGGKGGGRRGGGPPKNSDGEVPDEDLLIFRTVTGDSGTPAVADVIDDSLAIIGSTTNTPANIVTDAANDPEILGIAVQFTCSTPTVPTVKCYAEVLVDGEVGPCYVPIVEDGGAGQPMEPDYFKTFTPDTGGDVVADQADDTVTLAGGTAIATVGTPASDLITFNFDGDTWGDVTTDSGTASIAGAGYQGGLSIVGSGGIATSASGTTVTIDGSGISGGGNSFETWVPDTGGNIVADSATDTVTVVGGTAIQTTGTPASDTLTIDFNGETWGDITTDSGTVAIAGAGYQGGLSILGTNGITTAATGTTVQVDGANFAQAAWVQILGDTGSANADSIGDSLQIVGDGTYITTAVTDDPEVVTISWCLPRLSCAGDPSLAFYAKVCISVGGTPASPGAGQHWAVAIYLCTGSTI